MKTEQRQLSQIQQAVLLEVAGLRAIPEGAFSIRVNGSSFGMGSSEHITILPRPDGAGIDMHVRAGTPQETVHIPVLISETGVTERVVNDFFIGEGAKITIVAGCGIHNGGEQKAQHDGIHTFHIGKGASVKYIENHYGAGDGAGGRVLNPITNIYLEESATMEVETAQIEGVTDTNRVTRAVVGDGGKLIVKEKLLTTGNESAVTTFEVELSGHDSSVSVVSRSVAKDSSKQVFTSVINGNAACHGHSACDAILMGEASVKAVPEITANHLDAVLIHEAAIGRIANDQIIKLMTLGLTYEEAEAQIVNGFLK